MSAERSMIQPRIDIPGGCFQEDIHAYFNESKTRIPSVTQVFSLLGMIDYDTVSKEVLARKSQIGIAVHSAIEFLTEGALDWDTVDERAMPYVVAGETWMKEQGFMSLEQERRGIHIVGGMAFGFQYDQRGTMMYKGRLRHVILDLKTTVATSPTWKLQTAAYAIAAPKLPTGERYLRCILQLKADGRFTAHYYEDREDENSFTYALYTCIWMLNNGLATLERAA